MGNDEENEGRGRIENPIRFQRTLLLVLADILTILFGYFFALFLRFDFQFNSIEEHFLEGYLNSILI